MLSPHPGTELTLCGIEHLHCVDKVRSGVEVVWSWLLQPPQAEDDTVSHGTGSEGAAAGDTGVACPAPRLQVKGLKRSDRQFALPAPCAQTRCCGCWHPELAPSLCSASRKGSASCSAGAGGQHTAAKDAPSHSMVWGGRGGKVQGHERLLSLPLWHLPRTKILLPCRKAEAP